MRRDLCLMEALDSHQPVNLPSSHDSSHVTHGYGYFLSKVFAAFKVPCGKEQVCTRQETNVSRAECGFGELQN